MFEQPFLPVFAEGPLITAESPLDSGLGLGAEGVGAPPPLCALRGPLASLLDGAWVGMGCPRVGAELAVPAEPGCGLGERVLRRDLGPLMFAEALHNVLPA